MPPKRQNTREVPPAKHVKPPVKKTQLQNRPVTRRSAGQSQVQVPVQPPVVPNGQLLVEEVHDLKQKPDEPVLAYSFRILHYFNNKDVTEQVKMDTFRQNLLPELQQQVDLENGRKPFTNLTGMACFTEQRAQTLAKSKNASTFDSALGNGETSLETNTLVDQVIDENDRLRHRLSQVENVDLTLPRTQKINSLDRHSLYK